METDLCLMGHSASYRFRLESSPLLTSPISLYTVGGYRRDALNTIFTFVNDDDLILISFNRFKDTHSKIVDYRGRIRIHICMHGYAANDGSNKQIISKENDKLLAMASAKML